MNVTHYDLLAGIGGFSYAIDTIFNESHIKHIFCEWEAFPTAVLKKHWPEAIYYGDIADLVTDTASQRQSGQGQYRRPVHSTSEANRKTTPTTGDNSRGITIVTGGFPCQPFSQAGRRKGTSDDRYKWPEMFAVVQNVRPDWVIAENVRGLVAWNDGMVLETVCADLESEGYEVQPLVIPACAVGAPHRRDRVWIVARSESERDRRVAGNERRMEKRLVEPPKSQGGKVRGEGERCTELGGFWQDDWREVAFATCHDGVDDGLPRSMDGTTISASRHRKERLKACGNAIVPQIAMEIFRAIKQP
jgi:DNA (cytosine-5)-methyltransferase 1